MGDENVGRTHLMVLQADGSENYRAVVQDFNVEIRWNDEQTAFRVTEVRRSDD